MKRFNPYQAPEAADPRPERPSHGRASRLSHRLFVVGALIGAVGRALVGPLGSKPYLFVPDIVLTGLLTAGAAAALTPLWRRLSRLWTGDPGGDVIPPSHTG
jgi:hypothetical protein